jgi:heme-degrading monooxygenase HmoA
MFVRVWQFHVRPGHVAEFREVYGPGGKWVKLFSRSHGFAGTELFQSADDPAVFMTLDRWDSATAWETFLRAHADDYAKLDRECEPLAVSEANLGSFHDDRPPKRLLVLQRDQPIDA